MEERTGAEPVLEEVEMATGDVPVHDTGVGASHFEDYSGNEFEKVGEFTPEEAPHHPLPLLLKSLLKKPLPALNQEKRGLRPWLRRRIYLGSEIS